MSQLCNVGITTALTGSAQAAVSGFGTPIALSIQVRFTYVASAATSVTARIQTTLDGGTTWVDIAAVGFTTASALKGVNVSGLVSVTTPASLLDGSLTSNTVQEGFLGDEYRVKIDSVGTYGSGTQLAVDVFARY